ncbi:MAG: hypothetical protein ACRCX2_29885 [Paraclostridium sp.]
MAGYTVSYQETANNYDHTSQTIKGRQIPSIIFGDIPDQKLTPDVQPDHAGQMYIGQNIGNQQIRIWFAAGSGLLGGWKELVIPEVPTDVVQRTKANNFTEEAQTILGKQIVSVSQRPKSPHDYPEFYPSVVGQMYINTAKSPLELYISSDGLTWTNLSELYHTESEVKLDAPNNFTNTSQTINNRPIPTVMTSPNEPSLVPEFIGQLYFQYIPHSDTHDEARMWVASGTSSISDWKKVSDDTSVPDHVVTTDKKNSFTEIEQYINHNQIMTIQDGAWSIPSSSTPLDFDGQIYMCRHKAQDGSIDDIAAWMGIMNGTKKSWYPLFSKGNGGGDVTGAAMLDKQNEFTVPNQYIEDKDNQPGVPTRITGCRLLSDAESVSNMRPVMLGEMILKQSDPNVADPDMGNIWRVHVATSHRLAGFTELANAKTPNIWHERQYLGDISRAITGCRVVDNHPVENNLAPISAGEIAIHKRVTGGKTYRDVYVALSAADANSWVQIIDGQYQQVANLEHSNNFYNRHQYLGEYSSTDKSSYECIPGVRTVTTEVKGNITPKRRGEIVIQEKEIGGGLTEFQTWMSVREGNKDAWTLISSSTILV